MTQFAETAIETLWTTVQWAYIRKNIGKWQGAFIQFSPEDTWVSETPSVLTIEEDCPNQHMTLVLKRTPEGKPTHTDDVMMSVHGESQRFVAIDQHRWQAVNSPLQFWLLPGGVSCTVYPQLPRQSGVRLKFCWYLSLQQRQRIVRDYDSDGNWKGTSLMLETRV